MSFTNIIHTSKIIQLYGQKYESALLCFIYKEKTNEYHVFVSN